MPFPFTNTDGWVDSPNSPHSSPAKSEGASRTWTYDHLSPPNGMCERYFYHVMAVYGNSFFIRVCTYWVVRLSLCGTADWGLSSAYCLVFCPRCVLLCQQKMGLHLWDPPSTLAILRLQTVNPFIREDYCLLRYCGFLICCGFCWHLLSLWKVKRCFNIDIATSFNKDSKRCWKQRMLFGATFFWVSYATGSWCSSPFPSLFFV